MEKKNRVIAGNKKPIFFPFPTRTLL